MTKPKPADQPKLSKQEAGQLGAARRAEIKQRRDSGEHIPVRNNRKRNADDSDALSISSMPAAKSSKKAKTNMLSQAPVEKAAPTSKAVDVLPEAEKQEYVPKNLPGLKLADEHVHLPAVISLSNGASFTLTNVHTVGEEYKNFWEKVKHRVQQLQQVCPDEVFGTVLENMKTNAGLALHSAAFPTLLNKAQTLSYSKLATNAKHIGNESFKTYLNLIIHNASEMLKEIKNPNIAPANRAQDQAPGEITSRLISLTSGTAITAEEHNRMIRNVVANTNDAAELIRRELCSYGVAVGTIADRAIRDIATIRTIGNYVLEVLDPEMEEKLRAREQDENALGVEQGVHIKEEEEVVDEEGRVVIWRGHPGGLPAPDSDEDEQLVSAAKAQRDADQRDHEKWLEGKIAEAEERAMTAEEKQRIENAPGNVKVNVQQKTEAARDLIIRGTRQRSKKTPKAPASSSGLAEYNKLATERLRVARAAKQDYQDAQLKRNSEAPAITSDLAAPKQTSEAPPISSDLAAKQQAPKQISEAPPISSDLAANQQAPKQTSGAPPISSDLAANQQAPKQTSEAPGMPSGLAKAHQTSTERVAARAARAAKRAQTTPDLEQQQEVPPSVSSLPLLLIQAVAGEEAHRCRCPEICEPDFEESLVDHVKDKIYDEVKQQITDEEKAKIREDYRKQNGEVVKEEARKTVNKEAMEKMKTKAAKIERQQMEDQIRKELTDEITAGLEASFAARLEAGVQEYIAKLAILAKAGGASQSVAAAPSGASGNK
ncbi:hypothetical protein IMSHALPRED_008462 [Imshaugia aleurites]|uniref:Uncharacterized protein n=1 Tax=Imshaugia aleurites TaxID=172621 RepID=A0A8H3ESS3_9LECA|nr:hypothetical protein IMSHALPRED_008462 [Imshaugia aleurites]